MRSSPSHHFAKTATKMPPKIIAPSRNDNVVTESGTAVPNNNSPINGPVNGASKLVNNTISMAIGAENPRKTHIQIVVPMGGDTAYQVTSVCKDSVKPITLAMLCRQYGMTINRTRERQIF